MRLCADARPEGQEAVSPRTPKGRFAKGSSGNPGGQSKRASEIRALLMPSVMTGLEKLKRELESTDRDSLWRWALEFILPYVLAKPKGDEAAAAAVGPLKPSELTTTALIESARQVLGLELARLKAAAESGEALGELASVRLTECVKQLATLAQEEGKLFEKNPNAKLTDAELREKAKASLALVPASGGKQ